MSMRYGRLDEDTPLPAGPSSVTTQANALIRKNLTFQLRNKKSNCALFSFPLFLFFILVCVRAGEIYQYTKSEDADPSKCVCTCVDEDKDGSCKAVCKAPNPKDDLICSIPSPPEDPPVIQVPAPKYRAVRTDSIAFPNLPIESCRETGTCPATVLITGSNRTFGKSVGRNFFGANLFNATDEVFDTLPNPIFGSSSRPQVFRYGGLLQPANPTELFILLAKFLDPLYALQYQCPPDNASSINIQMGITGEAEATCLESKVLWRKTSSAVNDELFKGYMNGNSARKINEILAAYDFSNTGYNTFNVSIWYNSTFLDDGDERLRVPGLVNMVSNAYLKFLRGGKVTAQLDFVKEMPQIVLKKEIEYYQPMPLLVMLVVLQLFPVMITSLVYEKEQKLRIMMKMHGLGDAPYWIISYAYFFIISSIYILCIVFFGSMAEMRMFTDNAVSVQFAFFFLCINLQIVMAFLFASIFSSVKTATVVAHLTVLGSGLLGAYMFEPFIKEEAFPRQWLKIMELFPTFSIYRGLFELYDAIEEGSGMIWKDMHHDKLNGMKEILFIMNGEWCIFLIVARHLDKTVSGGSGVRKHPLSFLRNFQKKQSGHLGTESSNDHAQMDKPDILQERKKVEQLLSESSQKYAVVCDTLEKTYPGMDGNPDKYAVRGFSLAIPQGQCFGMLGPNGAGKSSSISMMIGLTSPSSGTAYIQGMDIRTDMDSIYTSMGVCPQHDLLWGTLTGREHLLFYGRLKNLKGAVLTEAVEDLLKRFNLFHGGVADKQSQQYSGGMKRRLSVAISLIGDPKVVYLDEPSTGLDPASRSLLWNVVKRAKKNRAIILTTHSMEEVEYLCDRLGIFVNGNFTCIGNAKELKGRYGGTYVFTMTTPSSNEDEVVNLVRQLSPGANRIYHLSGTQKFELPKDQVRIADVFQAVEDAKRKFTVKAWGLTDTTLEDVFIKVARSA